MFDRLKSSLKHHKDVLEYKDSAFSLLQNLTPNPQIMARLVTQRSSLRIEATEARSAHQAIFSKLASSLLSSPSIQESQLTALAQTGTALGVQFSDLPPHDLAQLQTIASVLQILRGSLPQLSPDQSRVHPQKDEIVHLEAYCHLLEEKTYRTYQSQSNGFSFRVAKGVHYHVGATRGRSIPHSQMVLTDSGFLSITSKRLVYFGSKQNFSAAWSKIIHVEPASNGIAIASSTRKKNVLLKYDNPRCAEVVGALVSHYVA